MALIDCQHLTVKYDKQPVLNDVSFTVDEGDYLCIIGENGSGKSTLMKALLKLIPFQGGNILYENVSPKEIGYLPQQTVVQKDFPASVYEVVLSGCLNRRGLKPFYSKKEKNTAEEKMKQLNISHLKKSCYRELSGGQQQRVLLARALCAANKLILLDEPVSGLDPIVKNEFYSLIHCINLENKITVVMISHDMRGIMRSASKILHLNTKTVFYGNPDDYKNSGIGRMMMGEK